MKIMVVDDDKTCLRELAECIKKNYLQCEVIEFSNGKKALEYGSQNKLDAVFTEVNLRGINGFSLIKELRKYNKDIDVTFVTDTDEYAVDAFQIHADSYILKPISDDAIQKKLQYK